MPRKKVTPLKKGDKKTTKAEMQARVDECKSLIAKGVRGPEINKQLSKKYNVAESTISKSLKIARNEIKKMYEEEVKEVRDEKLLGMERDRDEAYQMFQMEVDPLVKLRWYDTYQKIKDVIRKFYPNLIQAEEKGSGDIIINIDTDDSKL